GKNERQPRIASGTASAAVDQSIGMPKTIAANAIVIVPLASASMNGNTAIDRTPADAPKGDTTNLSNVPATSSWRTWVGRAPTVEKRISMMTSPITANAKY